MKDFSNVELEYNQFKLEMLSRTPREIYDNCNIIRFYENLYEYCIYNEEISEEFAEIIEKKTHIIYDLYQFYLKSENLSIDSWGEIDELIGIYLCRERL